MASDDGQAFFAAAVGAWMAEPEAISKLVSTNYRLHCEKYALMAENASQAARIAALEAENKALREALAGVVAQAARVDDDELIPLDALMNAEDIARAALAAAQDGEGWGDSGV